MVKLQEYFYLNYWYKLPNYCFGERTETDEALTLLHAGSDRNKRHDGAEAQVSP